MLARMRPVVSRRASAALPRRGARRSGDPRTVARSRVHPRVLTTACGGSIPAPEVQTPEGRQFIPLVPDSIDDVGLAPSVAVDGQGLPMISYFGFPAVLEEGEIPIARPVGSPFLTTEDGDDAGAVLLASRHPGPDLDPRRDRPAPRDPRWRPRPVRARRRAVARLAHAGGCGGDRHRDRRYRRPRRLDHGRRRVLRRRSVTVRDRSRGGDPGGRRALDRGRRRRRAASSPTRSAEPSRRCGSPNGPGRAGGRPRSPRSTSAARDARPANPDRAHRWRTARGRRRSVVGRGDRGTAARWRLEHRGRGDGRDGWRVARHRWRHGRDRLLHGGRCGTRDRPVRLVVGRGRRSARGGGRGRGGLRRADGCPPRASRSTARAPTWVAWQDAEGIHLASSGPTTGSRRSSSPDTSGGVNPSLAVTEDGSSVYLAWYDSTEGDLRLGTYGEIHGPADRRAAAAPVGRPAAELGRVWRGRPDRPRHRGARHRVRPDLLRGSGRRGLHDHLRQPRPGATRSAQHRDRRR